MEEKKANTTPAMHPMVAPTADLSVLLINLLKNVLYRDGDERQWAALLNLQARVRDYVAVLNLDLVLDEAEGYAFLADRILDLHDRNPQVASRLARCFDRWKKFDNERQRHARSALERVRDHQGLSRDVLEVVTRALGD